MHPPRKSKNALDSIKSWDVCRTALPEVYSRQPHGEGDWMYMALLC